MPFDIGDSVPISFDVRSPTTGALVNATTVTLTITLPDGSTVNPSVTNPPAVTGQYREFYVPTVEGRFAWRAVTTSPNTAHQDTFEVRGTVSPALLSLDDGKRHLKITTTSFDDELKEFLEAAIATVEDVIGPVVRRTLTTRQWGGWYRIYLPKTQVLQVTSMTLVRDGTTPVLLSDIIINANHGVISRKSEAPFPDAWFDIGYIVGRLTLQANWTLAAKLVLQHLWESKLGTLQATQTDERGDVVTGSGFIIPYRALTLLPESERKPLGMA